MKVEVTKQKNSTIEINAEIPVKDFDLNKEAAIKKLGEKVEVAGFRKGHIPENVLLKHIPEASVLEEMAEQAISKVYQSILIDNKIDAIGQPEITITKIAQGNPLGFKIVVAVMPEVILPDIKTIAKKEGGVKEKIEVTDKDVEDTIMELRRLRAKAKHDEIHAKGAGHNHEEAENLPAMPAHAGQAGDLPEIDDEFVKSLGKYKDVEDFKNKLRENIQKEKEFKAKESKRLKIIDAIVDDTKVDLPRILIDVEIDKMMHRLQGDLAQAGFKMEDYLKQIKKTEEEIQKEWEKDAKKRAIFQLIVNKIAIEEDIKADKDRADKEMKQIMTIYKDADEDRARAYVENVLINEKVFEYLEKLAD